MDEQTAHDDAVAAATVLAGLAATTAAVATDESAAGAGGSGLGDRDRCALPGPYELPHDGEPVNLHARDFSTHIDNAYWPMRVGTIWRYVSTDARGQQAADPGRGDRPDEERRRDQGPGGA